MSKTKARDHKLYCKVCGNGFTSPSYAAMYCSDACKMKAYRANKKASSSNAKASKAVSKKSHQVNTHKFCPHCDAKFKPGRADQKFCSASCRVVANRNKQSRTVTKIARETKMTVYQAYQVVDKTGWQTLYDTLQKLGFKYDDRRELWLTDKEADLAKLL